VRVLTERTNAPTPFRWARSSWPTKQETVWWLPERSYRATEDEEREKAQSHLNPLVKVPKA